MSVFGPLVPDTTIEDQITRTLKGEVTEDAAAGIEGYLGEVERVTGRTQGAIQSPRWGVTVEAFRKRPENSTPFISVLSGGIEGDPVEDGDGLFMAWYRIEVTAIVSASTAAATESLAKAYAAAIEGCLLQAAYRGAIGDPIEEIRWRGHVPEDFGDTDRSMVAMTCRFSVLASAVLQRRTGPLGARPTDPRAPYPALPAVSSDTLHIDQ